MLRSGPSTNTALAAGQTGGFGLLARAEAAFAIQFATIVILGALCLTFELRAARDAQAVAAAARLGIERVARIGELVERFKLVYANSSSDHVPIEHRIGATDTLYGIAQSIRQVLRAEGADEAGADPLLGDALRPTLDAMGEVMDAQRRSTPDTDISDQAVSAFDGLTARALDIVAFEHARQHKIEADARAAASSARMDAGVTVGGLVLALLACGGGLANSRRSILRVGRIARALNLLAAGDTNLALPPVDRDDEVGAMADAASAFHQTLLELLDRRADLRTVNDRFDTALNSLDLGVALFDPAARLLLSNDRFQAWFDAPYAVLPLGTHIGDVTRHIMRLTGMEPGEIEREIGLSAGMMRAVGRVNAEQVLRDGRVVAIKGVRTAARGVLVTYEDVTERRRSERQVAYLAEHDALTGLPNRAAFRDRLATMLKAGAGAPNGCPPLAVLCLDVDHFAAVNEEHGLDIGDALLVAIAARVQTVLRDGDTLARLGADEFAIIQCQCDRPEHASALAARVVAALEPPILAGQSRIAASVTIGIAPARVGGLAPEQLLREADLALVRAKDGARGGWRFFEPAMDAAAQARRTLESDLRAAVAAEAFEVYFQPLVSMALRRIAGFEALVRWRHPERGIVSPAEFIPLCEETGLIVPLGEWVLRRACAEATAWPDHVKVAVNLSPVQFRGRSIVETVAAILKDTGLAAHRLELEITESVLLTDGDDTLAALHALRRLGVRISMDDFGTGYSSLSYLRSFPFDKIKIDRSFIMDMDQREDSVAIVRAVAGLGSSLGITTTAEGVETQAQLDQIAAEGCDEVQGYFFSPPRPAHEVAAIIRRVDAAANRPLAA